MGLLFNFIRAQFTSYPPAPTTRYDGRTIIVTGGNSGLGKEAVRSMASLGAARIIIACRNLEAGRLAAKDIQASTSCSAETLDVWKLDMSSYASILAFADRASAELPRLDALLLNAGIGTREFHITEDNEESITTNAVATALLAYLLHPKLRETAREHKTQTHLTLTGSELYQYAKFREAEAPDSQIFKTLNDEKTANMGERYHVSKLIGMIAIKQLAAQSPLKTNGVIINSVGPGFCHSNLGGEASKAFAIRVVKFLFARPTEVGARTLVFGASAGPETHGQYLPDCKVKEMVGPVQGAAGVELQRRVWAELSQKLEAIKGGVTKI